jgi:hypothetical protein
MSRLTMIRASLILLAISANAGCIGKDQLDVSSKKKRVEPQITPEQARAALLKLGSLRTFTGGEDSLIRLNLKSGAVARTNDSVVTIGRFYSCNLKERTWRMEVVVGNVSNPRMHYSAGAEGRFEFQSDGTWRAVQTSGYQT